MGNEDVNEYGNEYVDTRKGYVALATHGRVALILRNILSLPFILNISATRPCVANAT